MRRIFAFILLLIYFSLSTGFVVSMHYCMNRFDSAQLGSSHKDHCHKCGMHNDGCCRDEVAVIKLQTAHMSSELTPSDFSIVAVEVIHWTSIFHSPEQLLQKNNRIAPD